ncbi:ABC transporter substrate-binding protein [uncultured Methanospirillum sp.]|uniref:ABC transporter substrate-binding protein n=1 Tax=uncultured Methanospirillum sp. TaxID=262503 RepID=UPI0029C64C85|nr:ABC transporter substrate-binding protein [uncultured Methanospirillum sp.]
MTIIPLVLGIILFCYIAGCISESTENSLKQGINSNDQGQSVIITDALNRSVTFNERPRRIITANQGAVPLLLVLGAGERIVGVPSFVVEDPVLAKNLPNAQIFAGSLQNVNCEQIIALKPDLVIEYIKYKPKCNSLLEKAGIPILYFNSFDLPEVRNNIAQMGKLTGDQEAAIEYINFTNSCDEILSSRINNFSDHHPRVYMEFSTDYMTYGNGSKGDTLMNLLQVENIAHNLIEYPTITPEWILKEDPDIIIKTVSSTALRENSTTLEDSYRSLLTRSGFSNLTAVKNNQVFVINNDLLMFTRQPAGALYLAKILYPEKFSDIEPQMFLTEYAEKFMLGSDEIPTVFPNFQTGRATNSTMMLV